MQLVRLLLASFVTSSVLAVCERRSETASSIELLSDEDHRQRHRINCWH